MGLIHEGREEEGVGAYAVATVPLLALLMFLSKKPLEVIHVVTGLALLATAVWFLLTQSVVVEGDGSA